MWIWKFKKCIWLTLYYFVGLCLSFATIYLDNWLLGRIAGKRRGVGGGRISFQVII